MRLRLDGVALKLPELTLEANFDVTTNALGIFGPSGAGKTTLLEIIARVRKPDRGRIYVDDQERPRIGYVPQDETLFPHMSVRGNVMYGARRGAKAPIEDELLDRSVDKLSGGERRRVAIARALMAEPRLLLLDEPLTGLDAASKERIIATLRELETPMIFVSHERDDIAALCEHVVTIERGQCSPPASLPHTSFSLASRPQLNR